MVNLWTKFYSKLNCLIYFNYKLILCQIFLMITIWYKPQSFTEVLVHLVSSVHGLENDVFDSFRPKILNCIAAGAVSIMLNIDQREI